MKQSDRLKIYDMLRAFQKNKIFPILDKELSDWDRNALEALSGVLYLTQGVFCKEEVCIK